ncbi:hypothetical protein [Streptosporangium amethystogenes]|uniref:hypothetical protein n=1 Tax=Streptosporangium amethystogenes TaxID=2002 RepID=UPI0012F8FAC5|nr:hypothetical protein [Streptosporangium amethystogenes]
MTAAIVLAVTVAPLARARAGEVDVALGDPDRLSGESWRYGTGNRCRTAVSMGADRV